MSNGHESIPEAERRYFDGDESRYAVAQADAMHSERVVTRELALWQLMSFLLLALVIGISVALIYISQRPIPPPKVVARNEHGQFRIINWEAWSPTEAEQEEALANWLWCTRSITTDREVQRLCAQRVALMVQRRSQCAGMIMEYIQQRRPEQHLHKKAVLVEQLRGGREADGRWQFTWIEKTYQLDHGHTGPLLDTTTWRASIVVTRQPPEDPKTLEPDGRPINAMGLLCTHLSWWN